MSNIKIVCIILAIFTASCDLQNFQDRAIYLGENDNVCRESGSPDKIRIIANLDGGETKEMVGDGLTICHKGYIRYADAISTIDSWSYLSQGGVS